jgi:hypothetical protein
MSNIIFIHNRHQIAIKFLLNSIRGDVDFDNKVGPSAASLL